jgi:hypothetical protein
MFTLSTPVPAKLASRGGDVCPARCHGRGFRTGSDRVPVGFHAVSYSQDPIIIRRFRSSARAERGRILSDRYVTSSRQTIPAGFPGSDVKVWAVGCLCARVDEQPRGAACPHAAAPPWWQEGLVSEHHDHPRARGPGLDARRQRAPRASGGGSALAARTAWASSERPLSQPGDRPRRLPHAVFGPDDHGPGPHPHSVPPSGHDSTSSPRLGGTAPLQARGRTRRGGNAESHHSASSRQQQTCRRSTAWPRAGLRGRRLPRHGPPTRTPSGDPREGRRLGP